jgi:regulator of sigma E protease
MSEQTSTPAEQKRKSPVFILIFIIALAWFIYQDPQRFYNILVVLAGFGAVIFVHELGHFAAAKSVGIFVEAFAIGFGPIVFGIKKVKKGLQFRILPGLLSGPGPEGAVCLIMPLSGGRNGKTRDGETEYQIRLIPLGGFVKMLGQEDTGPDKPSDDPRAYPNKAVWQRMIVISAGVVMNVICGALVFMAVFAHGVELPPAVVGDVMPNTPAAKAGIKGGDQIIAINGNDRSYIGFTDLMIASAFADENETIALTVVHADTNQQETLYVKPEMNEVLGMKTVGIMRPATLTIAEPQEPQAKEELAKLGIQPLDKIIAVNGQPVSRYDQAAVYLYPEPDAIGNESVSITLLRKNEDGQESQHDVTLAMPPAPTGSATVLGIVPRLKISSVLENSPAQKAGLQKDDIIIRAGTISTPSSEEIIAYCSNNENKPIELTVMRYEENVATEKVIPVTPQRQKRTWLETLTGKNNKPVIGIRFAPLDINHAVVAECTKYGKEQPALLLPRGATIVSIGPDKVANFKDMITSLVKHKGSQAQIEYLAGGSSNLQSISVDVPADNTDWIGFAPRLDLGGLIDLPFTPMTKLYKGENALENLAIGSYMTRSFITQTYLFLRGMFTGAVSPKAASGPVGIMKMSYTVVSQRPVTYYFYFMAMISICIAVFNFLPLPILDGGVFVLLIIEKLKGSPVSMKIQEVITYAGFILIGAFFLFVTYQDIVKWFTGKI